MKLGYVGTFSGYAPGVTATEQLVVGIQSHFAAINDAGGLDGESVELVTADDRGDPETGKTVARRLIEEERVPALVFVAASIVMEAVLTVASESSVPIVGTGGSLLSLFRPPRPWLFTARTPYESHARAMAAALVDDGAESIALVSTADGTGRAYAAGLQDHLQRLRCPAAIEELVHRRDQDIESAARRVAASDVDAVICTHFAPTSAQFVRAAAGLDFTPTWAFGPSATNPETAALVGANDIDGSYGQSSFLLPDSDHEAALGFCEDVQRHAPDADVTSLTQLGYVTARATVDAIHHAGAATGPAILGGLESLVGDYGLMPPFHLSPAEHLLNTGVQLVRFSGESMVPHGPMVEVDADTGEVRRGSRS